MTSKSLTHIFMIMRDKAIQRRNVYQRDEAYSDRDSLIQHENMEMGLSNRGSLHLPDWAALVEEVHFNIAVLGEKTKKLSTLQMKLIRCPSLDDNTDEEKQLSALATEIRMSLERCQKLMLQLKNNRCHGRENLLNKNVARALANGLQDAKNEYINACSNYTSTMNNFKKTSTFLQDPNENDNDYTTEGESSAQSKAWAQDQLLFLEDNSYMTEERDKAVQNIFKSTLDLNQLFRDVAQLVQEQGTIVDRIDFNVEQTSCKVEEGSKHLCKAEQHQRKNRKMFCILGLSAAIVLFILLLILLKS